MRYQKLVSLYQELESTSKRLEKTYLVSEFLKHTSEKDLSMIILLVQGKIFPSWDERKIGVASKMVIKAITKSLGVTKAAVEKEWKKTGDLGTTTENLVGTKKQRTLFSTHVTVEKVFKNLRKLSEMEGSGSVDMKVSLISELLTNASPEEARYVVRNVLEDLRVGVGEGSLRDAIVWAFFEKEVKVNYDRDKQKITPDDRKIYNEYVEAVQEAYDVVNDFSEVAVLAKSKGLKGLKSVGIDVGKPMKVMLFPKAVDIEDAFERVGKPAAFEFKYDGFRMQIHKNDGKIKIYTRRLDEVTRQFPEVVEYVKSQVKGSSFILDAEAVGYDPKTKKYLAFQKISQRIKRKYDIAKMAKDYPIEVNVFDILSYGKESLLKKAFQFRRSLIEEIVKPVEFKIVPARQIITDDADKADKFYKEALKAGQEGVMAKNLEGIYKPGSRVGYGVKVKPVMETLDLVIVGAEWGEGKRSGWLTSFTLACVDLDSENFLEIGKVGTGLKELETEEGVTFEELTKLLQPHIKAEDGRKVTIKPKIIVEIEFEEIQKSPTYSSGYALRFPRVKRLRHIERKAKDASDLDLVKELYKGQRSRHK